MAVKYERNGYMVAPPKRGKGRGGWSKTFTLKWGGCQNRPTGRSK